MAWSLADTRMRILCLEQGDWIKSTEFPSNGRDWEARRAGGDFDISPNRRGRDTDYPVNDDNSPMKVANFNGVGGGTVIYTAHWPRLHPSDFRVRSFDGVADDWPIDYWALERFYEENDRMMGVVGPRRRSRRAAAPSADAADPARQDRHALRQAMNRLGWHWWPSDTTIATTEYDGRAKCINLGHCTPGCAQGAKASTDLTYWPLAIRAGVELRTRCRVREITTDSNGMASGAIYYDKDGQECFQPAELVIVACNGVGTPRLLLNSASARFPNGLANSSRPGRQEPDAASLAGGLRLCRRGDGWRARADHLRSGASSSTRPIPTRDFVRGYTLQFGRGTGPATQAMAGAASGHLPWGRDHHRVYRDLLDHRVNIGVACDDLPEEHNRVTLDPVLKDSNGIPAPQIDYTISDNTRAHDGARHRPRRGDPDRGRRQADLLLAHRAQLSRPPVGHGAHGQRPRALGGQRMGPQPRREEPVHRRRQRVRDRRRREGLVQSRVKSTSHFVAAPSRDDNALVPRCAVPVPMTQSPGSAKRRNLGFARG